MSATRVLIVAACLAVALPTAARAGEVRLSMQGGHVTLVARDATVRQILTEWARVGKTRIVNMERVPGGPVSLEFRDVPESQALATILRTVGGYMAAPRHTADATLSRFDRIVVMPTLAPAAPATASAAVSRPAPPAPNRFPGGMGPGGMPGRFPGRPGADPNMGSGDPEEDEEEPVEEDEEEDVEPDIMDAPTPAQPVGLRQPGMMPTPEPPYRPGVEPDTRNRQPAQPSLRPMPPAGAAVPGMIAPGPTTRPQTPPQPTKPPGLPD